MKPLVTIPQGRRCLQIGGFEDIRDNDLAWRALQGIGWCQDLQTTDWSFEYETVMGEDGMTDDAGGDVGNRLQDRQLFLALAWCATVAGVVHSEEPK